MIFGDHLTTVKAIARLVGILKTKSSWEFYHSVQIKVSKSCLVLSNSIFDNFREHVQNHRHLDGQQILGRGCMNEALWQWWEMGSTRLQ